MKEKQNHICFLCILFLFATEGFVAKGQEKDSLYLRGDSLEKEAALFTDKALNDGVISTGKRDSLMAMISSSGNAELDLRIKLLQSVIDSIDSDYEASIKAADDYAVGLYMYRKSMQPERLSAPGDYISPEESRELIRQRTAVSVSQSMAETFKAGELMGWQKWMRRHGLNLFGNQAVYEGKAIPQMGGLYYITVPGGAPSEDRYGPDKFPKQR